MTGVLRTGIVRSVFAAELYSWCRGETNDKRSWGNMIQMYMESEGKRIDMSSYTFPADWYLAIKTQPVHKPCPRCGEHQTDSAEFRGEKNRWFIACGNCGLSTLFHHSEERAWEDWDKDYDN